MLSCGPASWVARVRFNERTDCNHEMKGLVDLSYLCCLRWIYDQATTKLCEVTLGLHLIEFEV